MRITGGTDIATTGNKTVYLEMAWNGFKKASEKADSKHVWAMSSKNLTFRILDMPFNDKKKTKSIMQEELSYSLAFPIDQCVWDFLLSPQGQSLAIVSLKKQLPVNVKSPDALDCDVTSLVRSSAYCGYKNSLIIDFGASKTLFLGLKDLAVNFVTAIPSGGDELTSIISIDREITRPEAEITKKEQGLLLPKLKQHILNLIKKAQIPQNQWESIVICGGGAQLKGLRELLSEGLKLPVKNFEFPEEISPFYDAVAFGCAIREKYPNYSISLIEEAKHGEPFPVWLAVAVAIPFLLLPIHLFFTVANLEKERKGYDNSITTAIRREIPDMGVLNSPINQLESKLIEKKSKQGKNSSSNILSDFDSISQAIKDKPVIVYDIDFSKEQIVLAGEADSYKDLDSVKSELQNIFSDIKYETKTLPSKKITFKMTIKSDNKKVEKSDVVKV